VVQTNEAIASYAAAGPVMGDPMACATWVPPGLSNCQGTCSPAAPGGAVIGEALGLQTYFPNPNDTNQNEEPGSMAINSEFGIGLIQTYQQQYSMSGDGGTAPPDFNPHYPYAPSGTGGGDSGYTPTPGGQPPNVTGTNFPFAWGQFDTVYPVNGVCTVSKMYGSNITYPTFTLMGNMMGGTTIDYEWSNVRVVIDTQLGAIGDQIFGDLNITQDGCSQSFHVSILAPKVSCNVTDDAGNNIGKDPTQCNAGSSNPDQIGANTPDATMQSQLYGSGILPGIPVNCINTYPPPAPNDAGMAQILDFECMPAKTGP
jgi:hypothetical protein